MYQYRGIVTRVIDGDTVVVDLDLGFKVWLRDQHVRLEGVDTPELRSKDPEEREKARAAKKFVEGLLAPGTEVVVESKQWDKYGRVLGKITIALVLKHQVTDEPVDIGWELVMEGHANPIPK